MWDEKLPLNRKIQLIGPTTLFLVMPHSTLEKAMAPHSSTLAWKIPWAEEPGGLQSVWSLESDTTERLHFPFSVSCIGEGNGNPLQCSCLENPRDGGAWWAAVHGVAQSQAQLKRLSSSSIAHGVLVPQPGIETVTPAVKAWSQPLDCQGILRPTTLVVRQNILWSISEVSIRRQNLGPALGILSSKCDQVWLNPDLNLAAISWFADINSISSSGLYFQLLFIH